MSEQEVVKTTGEQGKTETIERKLLREKFNFFGVATGIYAVFFAFCMYRNFSGVTYPLFLLGSLLYFEACLKKLCLTIKKDIYFYIVGILLLGISTALTGDGRIIFFNHAGAFLLMISLLLHQFFCDEKWSFGQNVKHLLWACFGTLGAIDKPFRDLANYYKEHKTEKSRKFLYIGLGFCIMLPLLLLVWSLLVSADAIFFLMTERMLAEVDFGTIWGVLFLVIGMYLAAYGMLVFLSERRITEEERPVRKQESILAITVALPITILYMVFCGVQVLYLFTGNVAIVNMSYAQYARQGFFQLLAVCVINLILVLIGSRNFDQNVILKTILTVMSVCTYVMIFSSGFRMILYIQHYYLTFLRILVLWALVVIFLLLTGVLLHIYKPSFSLFRYGVMVVTVCYILLSFSKPDYWIAKCNLDNSGKVNAFFDADAYQDYRYLGTLSTDAAPVILEYMGETGEDNWGDSFMERIKEETEDMGIREFNVSKYQARKLLNNYAKTKLQRLGK